MIGPVVLQGITQTVQEVSSIKAHENAKPHEDQVGLQHVGQKETDHKRETVVRKSDPAFEHQKHDAKEKSKGEYYNPSQQNKKRHHEESEDGVIIKKEKSFDVKI